MDYAKTKVRIVYRYNLDPSSGDPVHRLAGESYWVRDVEQALLTHPRAEIVAFEGEWIEPTTTELAKKLAGLVKRKSRTVAEEPAEEVAES